MAEDVWLVIEAPGGPVELEAFRQKHIHHPGRAVPLHVTLASGICHPDALDDDLMARLSQTCCSVAPFDHEAVCVNAFPDGFVLWFAPIPVSPFESLMERLYEDFPHIPRRWKFPTFHMTIGLSRGKDEMYEALAEFRRDFAGLLPLKLRASKVSVWIQRDDDFRRHGKIPLGG